MPSIKIAAQRDFRSVFDEFFSNFKVLSFKYQVIVFVLLFMALFLIVILYMKFTIINLELDNHINTDIKQQVVYTYLNNQEKIQKSFDLQNSKEYVDAYSNDVTFLKILNLEMKNKMNSIKKLQKQQLSDFNNGANKIFSQYTDINFDILVPPKKEKVETINKYLKNENTAFASYLYEVSPLLFQFNEMKGIKVNSYFFLSFDSECSESSEDAYFFKYPIHILDQSPQDNNFEVHDSIADPVIPCTLSKLSLSNDNNDKKISEKNLIINNNWFYNIYNQLLTTNKQGESKLNIDKKQSLSQIIKFIKIGLNLYREEMSYTYDIFESGVKEGKKTYDVIISKIDLQDKYLPYMNNKFANTTKDYEDQEIISFVNYLYEDSFKPIKKDASDKIYYNEYNIDDSSNQIMIIPTFLINLFRYTFFPNKIDPKLDEVNENIILNTVQPDVNSLMLSQQVMMNIDDPRYIINSYFSSDANFYTLMTYFNNYLSFHTLINNNFKVKGELNLLNNSTHPLVFNSAEYETYKMLKKVKYETTSSKVLNPSPCYISNMTSYYNEIKDLVNCKEQICSIIDCSKRDDLYIKFYTNPASYGNLPNCYCLPLLCYDDQTIPSSIPNEFKELYDMIISDDPKNSNLNYTPYSFLELTLQCRMTFNKKHSVYNNFNYKLSLSSYRNANYKYQESFIYLTSEIDQELIIDNAKSDINSIVIVVSTSYSILVALVLLFFLRSVLLSIDDFKERIDSTSNIHRKILANSSIEMLRMTSEELEDDNQDNKECDDTPEDESKQLQKSVIQGFKTGKQDNKSNNDDQFDQIVEKTRNMENDIGVSPKNIVKNKDKIKDNDKEKDNNQPEEENRFLDELEELFCIINDNMKDFTMDFDINKNIYLEYPIVKKYSNYLRKKIYSFAILPVKKDIFALRRKKKVEERSFIKEESKEYSESDDDESYRSYSNCSEENDLNKKINHNLSINILSELLSTEYIDIGEYNKNFYFRHSQQESLFNFYDFINTFLINDETYVSEITDPEKLATAFRYINYEIVQKWLDIFLQDKEIDEF